jgi:acyl-CoA thioester hydrolase
MSYGNYSVNYVIIMARIRIDIPESFPFVTDIPVRITDLNYEAHVGNDSILALIHEARVQFLRHYGYSELDLAGTALIMGDVAIEFKSELFYGEALRASVAAGEFSRVGFALFYKLEKEVSGAVVPVAFAKTGMVCYNYALKKIVAVPDEISVKLSA